MTRKRQILFFSPEERQHLCSHLSAVLVARIPLDFSSLLDGVTLLSSLPLCLFLFLLLATRAKLCGAWSF